MRGVNKVIVVGNLGKDPELRYTNSGAAVCSFSVAVNSSWKDKNGETQEHTEWIRCTAWQKLAEICGEYLKKGSKLYLSGRMATRSYDDKDGKKCYSTEVVLDEMVMLDSKGESGGGGSRSSSRSQGDPPDNGKDDLPF